MLERATNCFNLTPYGTRARMRCAVRGLRKAGMHPCGRRTSTRTDSAPNLLKCVSIRYILRDSVPPSRAPHPDGDEILKDLGELEAVEQHGLPLCMNPRALKPKIIIPPSPKRPPPPQPLPTRPRKRGAFKADVEAGIIPPPRGMRRDAC